MRDIIPESDKRFRYAVEVRDRSWFQDLAYSFFANNKQQYVYVWSQLADIRTPPIVTTDFIYIRFIGDRTIQERDFGKIQKDRVSEMKRWARFVKRARDEEQDRLNLAIVTANNHYAGFGPGTVNTPLEKCWICQKCLGMMLRFPSQEKIHLVTQNKLVYQIF